MHHKHALRLALLCGVLGTALLRAHMVGLERDVGGGAPHAVLTLTRDAAPGTPIERAMLTTREIPESYLESRHIAAPELDRVVGARLAAAGRAGEALLWTDLAELGEGPRPLATLVPPGMRALVLSPKAAAGSELLRPGDRVDVLFTDEGAASADRTETLLQGILVLAVGSGGGAMASAGASRAPVTLGVDPDQAQLLTHADAHGRLRLVLRNPDDLVIREGLTATTSSALHPPAGMNVHATPEPR